MPADFSFGVSPPFPTDNQFFAYHVESFYPTTINAYDNGTVINRVPRFSCKNPKSCLKIVPPAAAAYDCKANEDLLNAKNSQKHSILLNSSTKPPLKERKKVTFADKNGGVLTLIKYLKESSSEPPKSFASGDFLKDLMKNMNLKPAKKEENEGLKLSLKFDQPASDYVNFKEKIEKQNVSLENVVIKDSNTIHGSVKVKNIAFKKTVCIRITFDNWLHCCEIQCEYVKNAYEGDSFDTFQFSVDIPKDCERIEFCVRYKCNDNEFWDNNYDRNYVVSNSNCPPFNRRQSQPVRIPTRNQTGFTFPYPTTYNELPTPQERTWLHMDMSSPFY